MKKVLLVTLGCAKNQVDSETLLSFFVRNGFEIVLKPNQADVIVINTCGFIEASKKESIDTIFRYTKYNAKLVVTGCLVQRYYDELKESIPEVDLFIPIRDYPNMLSLINGMFEDKIEFEYNPYYRVISTPGYMGYLKISDGCNNHCSYCAIPLIRGEFKSIPRDEVLKEAKRMTNLGIKELVIISQDTSKYGTDIYDNYRIEDLLLDILAMNSFKSIRLLYLYAYEVSDRFLSIIKENSEVLQPYFDLPIQHASNNMLQRMNRKDKKSDIVNLYTKIRKDFPKSIIRTTLIVGFPGETEDDFEELKEFITTYQFDHLGVFEYSKEEGTAGFLMKNQVPNKIKTIRKNEIMKVQSTISYELNKKHIGEVMQGFIVGQNDKNEYLVRTYFNAPDDIDGNIFLRTEKSFNLGDEVVIKITNSSIYDLEAILEE